MSHVVRSTTVRILMLIAVCATLTITAFAQSTVTGAIAGTVTDQSKAVVVGAKVAIRNIETNYQSSSVTDAQGKFRVAQLPPGTYSVTAEAANFAAGKAMQLRVEVGRITEVELVMTVAGKQETVQVTSEAPVINTMQQDFSTNLSTEAISNLPINGRRWSQYALLTPGANPDGNFGLISFRGISGLLNNNTVDGGDNNQAFFSEERGRTRAAYVISQSSVREFQVNTSNYSAEYGRAAGAVVNSVTKSGTNNIHGEGFWYIRDNALGAINPFWIKATQQSDGTFVTDHFKPDDRRQQFGGNVGGPVIKDKLFFFFNYDGQRRNFPGVGIPGSPAGFFSRMTTPADLDSKGNPLGNNSEQALLAIRMLGLYDSKGKAITPNADQLASATTVFNQYMGLINAQTGETPRRGDQDIFFPKLDWRITQNNTFSASYNRMRWNSPAGVQTQPTVTYAIDAFGNDYVKDDIAIGRLSSTLSNNMTNELRFMFGRDFEFQTSQPPVGIEKQFATSYGGRAPYMQIGGSSGINLGRADFLERPAYPDEARAQWSDTVNLLHGKHFFKFGIDLSRNDDLLDNLYAGGGIYSWSNRVDFISDAYKANSCIYVPKTGSPFGVGCWSSFKQAFGPSAFEFTNWDYAGFVQDDYRILPRLTLSFGVRYEYEALPKPQIPNFSVPNTVAFPADKNNLGPRVGFAYDMFGDGKTSLRGGYGLYYGRIINAAISNAITTTGMPTAQVTYSYYNNTGGAPTFPNVVCTNPTDRTVCTPSGAGAVPNVLFLSPKLQNPQIHQFDLVLEHEMARNTMLSVSYMGSLGRELPQYIDTNIKPATQVSNITLQGGPFDGLSYQMPIYTQRFNNAFGPIVGIYSNVNANYNALVVQFNRRMTNGLQFQTNYTWSHALDFGQGSQTSNTASKVLDPYCIKCEYGTSAFDIRHKFIGSVVYQPQMFAGSSRLVKALLNGWSTAPIVTLSSGVPYTEYVTNYVPGTLPSGVNGSGGGSRLSFLDRNNWRQPAIYNIDLRLSRSFKLHERHSVEFLAEAFNLFNSEQITQVNNNMYTLTKGINDITKQIGVYDPTFGTYKQAGATLYRERNVQFGIKYAF